MKKVIVLATAAFLFVGVANANFCEKGKKCEGKECKKDAKGKGKECCSKETKTATVKTTPKPKA
jgi:hypothetical protein